MNFGSKTFDWYTYSMYQQGWSVKLLYFDVVIIDIIYKIYIYNINFITVILLYFNQWCPGYVNIHLAGNTGICKFMLKIIT